MKTLSLIVILGCLNLEALFSDTPSLQSPGSFDVESYSLSHHTGDLHRFSNDESSSTGIVSSLVSVGFVVGVVVVVICCCYKCCKRDNGSASSDSSDTSTSKSTTNPTNYPSQPTYPTNYPSQPTSPTNYPSQPTYPTNYPSPPTTPTQPQYANYSTLPQKSSNEYELTSNPMLEPNTIVLKTQYNPLKSHGYDIKHRDVTGHNADLKAMCAKLGDGFRVLYHGTNEKGQNGIRKQDHWNSSVSTAAKGQDLGPGVYFADTLFVAKTFADGAGNNSDKFFECLVKVGRIYEVPGRADLSAEKGGNCCGHKYDHWQSDPRKFDSIHNYKQWAVRDDKNIYAYALYKVEGEIPEDEDDKGRLGNRHSEGYQV